MKPLSYVNYPRTYWQQGELENALDALDRAYALILRVDTSDQPKLIQQKEDLRFMISKRILEIYASRNIVVNGNHNAIPVVINQHVQAEIDLFTEGNESSFFRESYRRSGRYRDNIAKGFAGSRFAGRIVVAAVDRKRLQGQCPFKIQSPRPVAVYSVHRL